MNPDCAVTVCLHGGRSTSGRLTGRGEGGGGGGGWRQDRGERWGEKAHIWFPILFLSRPVDRTNRLETKINKSEWNIGSFYYRAAIHSVTWLLSPYSSTPSLKAEALQLCFYTLTFNKKAFSLCTLWHVTLDHRCKSLNGWRLPFSCWVVVLYMLSHYHASF